MITTIDTPSPNFSQRPEGVMPDMAYSIAVAGTAERLEHIK